MFNTGFTLARAALLLDPEYVEHLIQFTKQIGGTISYRSQL
jgi:hypothetical protein